MSETQNTQAEPIVAATEGQAPAARFRPKKRHTFAALAAIAIIGAGAAGGAAAVSAARANTEMAPVTPVAISALSSSAMVSVKGNVAEIFGNKFILQDGSGRALVETGPAGDNGKLVAPNEAVTVQGRFDNGFIHANFLVRSDGTVVAIGPVGPPPPPHGPRGPHDHAGGPDGRPPHEGPGPNDAPPPPPAPPAPDASGAPVAPPVPDAPAAPAAPAPAAGDTTPAPAAPAVPAQ
ncbi:hypothetical protein LB518_10985 [Mesorhizobium sp. BR1-1-16]|nr:hypothetical protein [Mesorhizobium sp. BR1-1-16]MBZ9936822.1 hypothetical protein [Mesorhizobium sp. BR1-1-16]